jgi:hypothetical protein
MIDDRTKTSKDVLFVDSPLSSRFVCEQLVENSRWEKFSSLLGDDKVEKAWL